MLITSRKNELAELIMRSGGLALDNRLIAGFVAYATNGENKDSEILQQLLEVGKKLKLPSKGTKQSKKRSAPSNKKD